MLGKAHLDDIDVNRDFLAWARGWMAGLREANQQTGLFDRNALAMATAYFWLLACRAAAPKVGRGIVTDLLDGLPLSFGLASPAALSWLRNAAPAYLQR